MSVRSRKVVVIGSGFGGLATAIRLQRRGYDVHLLEARDQVGGRAAVYRQDGFTFDAGPTVITAPFLLDELFQLDNKKTADYVTLVPVDPFYRIEFHDGRSFEYNADIASTERAIAEFSPDDVNGYRRMIRHAHAIFQKGFVELADKPFLRFGDMVRVAPDLIRLESYRTVYSFVSRYIRNELLRRVFSFHPLLVGGNPFQTTSIYALIHHLERQWGVWYVLGGTGALVAALARLFEELGGRISLSTPVRRILVEDGAAKGVETAHGERIVADAVVSNADVATTYRQMIDPGARRRNSDTRYERLQYSMSLFVIYFGTRRQYPGIRHHTIILSERYENLLDEIFNRKILGDEFSLYLHRPTATDSSMAPDGCDCWYALIPVPNQLSGIDWTTAARPFRDRVMQLLNDKYLPGLLDNIATELWFTPLDFEVSLRSYAGAAFSFQPLFKQSAWFRPHNESEDVRNLFFAGAGTHPGAGVPGVLSSAKIAESLVCDRIPI